MRFSINIFIVLLIASLLILCKKEHNGGVASVPCNIPNIEKTLIENSNQLGFDCFRRLSIANSEDENLIISPIGISLSLNSLLQASQNRTNSEIKNCLHLNNFNDSTIINGYNHLNKLYSEIDNDSKIINTSKIAFSESFKFEPNFQNFYAKSNYAEIISDNNAGFIDNINDNSSELNNGHFQMINSFNFDAKSKYQVRTEESPFYKSPNQSSFIQMIVSRSELNYYADQTVQAVELPLGRGNFNLLLILPQNSESINDLCNKMDVRILDRIKKKFKPMMIEVIMPKIELTEIKTMKEILKYNKIPSAFSDKIADFSKLSKHDRVYMNDFEHVINLSISSKENEEIEASNASPIIKKEGTLLIDHPYIFMIYEKYSEGILCIGKINNI